MILVLTSSRDFTTDSILSRINSEIPVFRFNIDLWAHYQWSINAQGFTLEDPTGRKCEQDKVGSVYLRKLSFDPVFIDVPAGGSEDLWCREELMQVWLGIRDWAHEMKRLALIKPSPHGRWNKIRQMKVASEYFPVPEWEVIHRSKSKISGPVVVKTIGAPRTGEGGLMLVREVDPELLSPDFPWFLQKKMTSASHDITVAWVAGKSFAYEVCRDDFIGDDVRLPDAEGHIKWNNISLTSTETLKINSFMERTGYDFGRLDFLRVNGELWFLEVNPNGQFAWLDPDGSHGLLDAVAGEILRVWEQNKKSAVIP